MRARTAARKPLGLRSVLLLDVYPPSPGESACLDLFAIPDNRESRRNSNQDYMQDFFTEVVTKTGSQEALVDRVVSVLMRWSVRDHFLLKLFRWITLFNKFCPRLLPPKSDIAMREFFLGWSQACQRQIYSDLEEDHVLTYTILSDAFLLMK